MNAMSPGIGEPNCPGDPFRMCHSASGPLQVYRYGTEMPTISYLFGIPGGNAYSRDCC